MNEQITQILGEIIKRYGVETLDDPKRFAGILQDYCKGEFKRERSALLDALTDRIPNNLLLPAHNLGIELLVDQQTRRLLDSRMMSEDAARDIVETWALALGVLDAPLPPSQMFAQLNRVGTPATASNPIQTGKSMNIMIDTTLPQSQGVASSPKPVNPPPSALSMKSGKSTLQLSLIFGTITMIGLVVIALIGIGTVSWALNYESQATSTMKAQRQVHMTGQAIYTAAAANVQETRIGMGRQTPTLSLVSKTRVSEIDGMEMVYIPAGEFLMGSRDGDSDAQGDEMPQRKVFLDAYWIDKTEVTNVMYKKCVDGGKCVNPTCEIYGDSQKSDHPVVCVDWNMSQTYCRWVGGSLPSEAQWEKAARGIDGRKYPWGDKSPTCDMTNYSGCGGDTKSVGIMPGGASPYGIMDMAGNVWEWVNYWYGENYYQNSPQKNPTGPDSGLARILRGGSWLDGESFLRTAYRNGKNAGLWSDDRGFRCVRY